MRMVFPVVAFFRLATLRAEPAFVFFLIEEKKRKLFLNRVDPLNSLQLKLLD